MIAVKRLLGLTVLVLFSSGPEVAGELAQDVREYKKHLKASQPHTPGSSVDLAIRPGETVLLSLAENPAGVTEFLLRGENDRLLVIFGCADEDYGSTVLTPKRTRDSRTIARSSASEWMRCTTQCEFQTNALHVVFSTEPISAEQIRKIKEEQQRAREARMDKLRRVLAWDESEKTAPIHLRIPGRDEPRLRQLREEYQLETVVEGAANEYDKLRRLGKWAHDRWQHNGDNVPSKPDPLTILAEAKQGKRFRCVEYATVVAGCAQSLGLPARCLALKREDVETAQSGAGHYAAEVWLPSLAKWVFVDGQWDAIPEMDGRPLNAVEFQEAVGRKATGLKIRSSSGVDEGTYLYWITPYLYYFDFNLDQQLFAADASESARRSPKAGKIMLVPKGAAKPSVFQRTNPIRNCTYISNPAAFYPTPASAPAR